MTTLENGKLNRGNKMDDAHKIEYVIEYVTHAKEDNIRFMDEADFTVEFHYFKGKVTAYNEILRLLNEEN